MILFYTLFEFVFLKRICGKCDIWVLQTDYADALPRFSQSSQSLRDGIHPYKNIYLCRFILRFSAFLSGMLTKYLLNARFQNSDFVFRQLKPGIIFARYAAKKVIKPRKSRRAKIYISVRMTCIYLNHICIHKDEMAEASDHNK